MSLGTAPSQQHAPWLDASRAIASLVVCFAHLRAFFLVDYEASGGGPVAQVFYLLTGLHHQAVMIFFVLSGYFVGGALLRQLDQRKAADIDWLQFAVNRLSRLWIVLVPALLLTLFWDRLGMLFAGPGPYQGQFLHLLNSGPSPGEPAEHGLLAFLGNVFFLQTIAVLPYGSNGPLWSLAYEGWYYLLFPLALLAVGGKGRLLAAPVLLGLVALLAATEPALLVLGLNWLFGVAVFVLAKRPRMTALGRRIAFRLVTLLLFAATLVASRAGLWLGHDLLVGVAFALVVTWLGAAAMPLAWLRSLATRSADFSYTLYLVHFPFQACLFFVLMKGQQLAFGLASLGLLAALFVLSLAYALLVWWCFERNTSKLRRRLMAMLRPRG